MSVNRDTIKNHARPVITNVSSLTIDPGQENYQLKVKGYGFWSNIKSKIYGLDSHSNKSSFRMNYEDHSKLYKKKHPSFSYTTDQAPRTVQGKQLLDTLQVFVSSNCAHMFNEPHVYYDMYSCTRI